MHKLFYYFFIFKLSHVKPHPTQACATEEFIFPLGSERGAIPLTKT